MSRVPLNKDIKLLYSLSAGCCNLCEKQLFEPKIDELGYTHIGQMAHIYSYADNGIAPRYIDGLSHDNSYDNLILLCANDHLKVDSNTDYYTVNKLHEIKRNFENKIKRLLVEQKNSSDRVLIDLIRENFNLQQLLASLDNPISYLPWCVGDVADIETFLLIPNCPSLYPFDDSELNSKMKKMLGNYDLLSPYINEYYFADNGRYLAPVREKPIPYSEQEEILKIVREFKQSIFDWLEYCRFNY